MPYANLQETDYGRNVISVLVMVVVWYGSVIVVVQFLLQLHERFKKCYFSSCNGSVITQVVHKLLCTHYLDKYYISWVIESQTFTSYCNGCGISPIIQGISLIDKGITIAKEYICTRFS